MNSYSTENEKILLATFESALMHLQKANKRLTIITVTALVLMGLMFGCFIYLFTGFEFTTESVTIDSHEGTANYIGNDGDITNGED